MEDQNIYVNTVFDGSKPTPPSHANADNVYETEFDGSKPTPTNHAKTDNIYANTFDCSKPTPPSHAKTDNVYQPLNTMNTKTQLMKPTKSQLNHVNWRCIYGIMIVLAVLLLCAVVGIILAALAFTKDKSGDILELNDTSAAGTITTVQHKLFKVQEAQEHIQSVIQSSLDNIKDENANHSRYITQLIQELEEFKHIAAVNECASSPCHNRGSCIDRMEGYTCICSEGFEGIQCEETSVNECASSPCHNKGSCIDRMDGYTCICSDGFTGIQCEEISVNECAYYSRNLTQLIQEFKEFKHIAAVNECASSPCHNRGLCIDRMEGYTCICSEGFTGIQCEETPHQDCSDIYISGLTTSGVYRIKPSTYESPFDVYCDMDSRGGGWTLIQRRFDGSENFNRTWIHYKNGFGNKNSEHWLGLEKVYHMTNKADKPFTFRVDLTDFDLNTAWQEYLDFKIASEQYYYNLTFSKVGYTGTAGDSLNYHYGRSFSTYDNDLDASSGNNYALNYGGAWWFRDSHYSALNNQYFNYAKIIHGGMIWYAFHKNEALKAAQMKIRPSDFCNYVTSC